VAHAIATKVKRVLVVCCLFVLYAPLLAEWSSDLGAAGILAGAVAATLVAASELLISMNLK